MNKITDISKYRSNNFLNTYIKQFFITKNKKLNLLNFFNFYTNKIKKKVKLKKIYKKVFIKFNSNNTIIATKNFKKNYILSCGSVGFKGSKRSSTYASQLLGEKLGENLVIKKENLDIILIFKGFGRGRKAFLTGLRKYKIKISKMIDLSPYSHNGCRSRKKKKR
jgi:small subunit ribosomal protein S11